MKKNFTNNIIFIFIILICFNRVNTAQTNSKRTLSFYKQQLNINNSNLYNYKNKTLESLRDSLNPRSSVFVPFTEVLGLNFSIGSVNAYISKSDFAQISWKSIKSNFRHGFGWDGDTFVTNMFGHPYHGSMMFSNGRANGYNYFESMGFAAFGSWQWEYFMEIEPPAINDWIMTSVSGSMLGEMMYRFSNFLIDESASGTERIFRELGAFAVDPWRGFNRLIHGRMFRHSDRNIYYHPKLNIGFLTLGMNRVYDGSNFIKGKSNLMLEINYIYGNPFSTKHLKPFDHFEFNIGINFYNQNLVGYIYSDALLYGKLIKYKHRQRLLVGIFQHYDYINTTIYEVGGTGVGLGLIYKFPATNGAEFFMRLHIGFLLMGGASSLYALDVSIPGVYEHRNYNLGSGLMGKFESRLFVKRWTVYIGYLIYWVNTFSGVPGDELTGLIKPKIFYRLSSNWAVGFEFLFYHRWGIYRDHPNVFKRNIENRIFVGFFF